MIQSGRSLWETVVLAFKSSAQDPVGEGSPTDIWKNKGEGINVKSKGQEARGSEKGMDGMDKCGIPRILVP